MIYDGNRPDAPPEANALYFGVLPPGPAYAKSKTIEQPVILDWDVAHPLLQFVRDLPTVAILKATTVEPPPGSTVLIESDKGPLAFVAPREGFSDTVVTFALMDGDKFNTNWYRNISFPLFLFNSLQVLGNARESVGDEVHLPGQPVILRAEAEGHGQGHRARRQDRYAPPDAARDVRGQPDRHAPASITPAGTLTGGSPSRSTCSTRARATSPPAASCPRASPERKPMPTGSRSATTPSPARGTPVRAGKTGGGGWRSWCWSSCCSSGIFTIGVFTSEV